MTKHKRDKSGECVKESSNICGKCKSLGKRGKYCSCVTSLIAWRVIRVIGVAILNSSLFDGLLVFKMKLMAESCKKLPICSILGKFFYWRNFQNCHTIRNIEGVFNSQKRRLEPVFRLKIIIISTWVSPKIIELKPFGAITSGMQLRIVLRCD